VPGWSEILAEITATAEARGPLGPDFDGVRDKYLRRLHERTGRAVIAYGSGWLAGKSGLATAVEGQDVHGFMEVCHGVDERELDLILHSPGGSPEAAEQIVEYLRTQYDYIRCFVPLQAKSAATMIALACDEIVMGHHSELGPIDPQVVLATPEGIRQGPAHGILRDFRRAREECTETPAALPAWTPILRSYVGGLLESCNQAVKLSLDLVRGWLDRYMLTYPDMGFGDDTASRKRAARRIANHFGSERSYDRFRTHGRPIRLPELEEIGVRVRRMGNDGELQDAVLSIFHATSITFNGAAAKIIENHLGRRFVRVQQQIALPVGFVPSAQD
jgi:hypothetical protein